MKTRARLFPDAFVILKDHYIDAEIREMEDDLSIVIGPSENYNSISLLPLSSAATKTINDELELNIPPQWEDALTATEIPEKSLLHVKIGGVVSIVAIVIWPN